MRNNRIRRLPALLAVLFAVSAVFLYSNREIALGAPVGTGFVAQILGAGVFVSGRPPEDVMREDMGDPQLADVDYEIDAEAKTLAVSLFGAFRKTAVFREGLGCSVLNGGVSEEELRAQPLDMPPPEPAHPAEVPWPTGDAGAPAELPPGVDAARLNEALDAAFSEPNPDNPRRTRAVAVVHKGQLIAERHAPGIEQDTPLIGWSMTKSAVNALVAALVGEGRIDLREPAPVPEWGGPDDPRGKISWNDLLQMSSGLYFEEEYKSPLSDVARMLFDSPDTGAFAADKPLIHPIGGAWHYSSGTTNIVARALKHVFDDQAAYFAFPRKALFNKLGMRTAVIQPDASGTFVGSSLMYASARDWARLGLLYLNDGVWEGERILPEGWVEYTTTPAPNAPMGRYGAHVWLNRGAPDDPARREFPELPPDLYWFSGFNDQSVAVIPSRQLVAVRLGMTHRGGWDLQGHLLNILKALPEE